VSDGPQTSHATTRLRQRRAPIALAAALIAAAALLGRRLLAQLERTHRQVADQLYHGRRLLDDHEAERGRIADQLHEQSAQTLAAALMALSLLEQEVGESRIDRARIETVRAHMRECMVELCGLADSLRPAVLADLGLHEALHRACERAGERSGRPVALHADEEIECLSSGAEATAYRTVEEVLEAVPEPTAVSVASADEDSRLHVSVTARADGRDPSDELARTRSRLQIVGGALRIGGPSGRGLAARRTIEAEIPLVAEAEGGTDPVRRGPWARSLAATKSSENAAFA
jgi:signal transduction histidine kinase